MPWCPKCKAEYREGFTNCADCGEPLMDNIQTEKNDDCLTEEKDDILSTIEPCLLTSTANSVESAMIVGVLEEAGIPSLIKNPGSGGYLKVYMGFSVFGEEIYVDKSKYEEAKALLDSFVCKEEKSADSSPEFSHDNTERVGSKLRMVMKILFFMVASTMVIGAIIGIINAIGSFLSITV